MLKHTQARWGAVAIALHWLMVLLIFLQLALGRIAEGMALSPDKLKLFVWHKSFGVVILLLVVFRLIWRLRSATPAYPSNMPAWEAGAARFSHALLYLLMLALPLTGWIINSAANIPFKVFWLVPWPDITGPDKALQSLASEIHGRLAGLLVMVLIIHIMAALRHHFIKRNDVLKRMLPGGRLPERSE